VSRQHVLVAALMTALALGPLVLPEGVATILNYTALFSLVAIGLSLLTGIGGMTSFGQAAFVGVGAYATAYLTTVAGLPSWIALLAGMTATGGIALVLGSLTLRLAGHYLPLSTIAWGLSLYFLAGNLQFLGGHTGLSGLPPIEVFGLPIDSGRRFTLLAWAFVLVVVLLVQNLLSSRQGRAIRALKGGRVMSESMGVDIPRTKLVVFVISAVLASMSGWLYAHLQRFVNLRHRVPLHGRHRWCRLCVGGRARGGAYHCAEGMAGRVLAQTHRPVRQLRGHSAVGADHRAVAPCARRPVAAPDAALA